MLPLAPWLVWVIPLVACLFIPLLARIGRKVRDGFVLIVMIITAIYAFSMIPDVFSQLYATTTQNSYTWIPLGSPTVSISIGVVVDTLSVLFAVLIAFFGVIIALYSLGYMRGEEGLTRYYFFLMLFIGSMIGLVMGDNFLQLFIFWEMVGFCSYALVSFWYKKQESIRAGIKVFLMTRVGDVFLLAAIVLLYVNLGSFSFTYIIANIGPWSAHHMGTLTIIAFCILGGAIAKSAQLPLHTWLYAAMEAPTSISALLHAATMVKAGVYLLARAILVFGTLAVMIPNWMPVIAWIGVLTALIGGTLALSSPDIKGVQAYSTVSQLGFMIASLGTLTTAAIASAGGVATAGWFAGLYQMMAHAFFQGLNFLLIGGIIHAVGTRDMRQMGGLRKDMPVTFALAAVYFVTAIGLPPLPTFFSKELIIDSIWSTGNVALTVLIYISTALTCAYALRYFILTFLGEKSAHAAEMHVHEPPRVMLLASVILAVLCLGFGFVGPLFGSFMGVSTGVAADVGIAAFANPMIWIFFLVILAGGAPIYYLYAKKSPAMEKIRGSKIARGTNFLLERGYFIDTIYEAGIAPAVAQIARGVSYVEKGFFDRLAEGIGKFTQAVAIKIKQAQKGSLQLYIAAYIAGIAVIIAVIILSFIFGWI